MKKKIAVVLIIVLLNYSINAFANIDLVFQTNIRRKVSEKNIATMSETTKIKEVNSPIEKEESVKLTNKTIRKATAATASNVSYINQEKDIIYKVSFPTFTQAYLDPGNLSGKGQIFSEHYVVENYGNCDVIIKIKHIDIYYFSGEDIYEFSEDKISDSYSKIKKLNINIVWKNEEENIETVLNISDGISDEYVLYLKAADKNCENMKLKDGSVGVFYFTGTMNANPDIVWEDNEIKIEFDYEIINVEEENQKDISVFTENIINFEKEKMIK